MSEQPEDKAYIIKQEFAYRGEIIEIQTEPRSTMEEAQALLEQGMAIAKAAIDNAHEVAEAVVEARKQARH
jgi:hypothetical protein